VPEAAAGRLVHLTGEAWEQDAPGRPRVLLFRDSFATWLFLGLLAEQCSRLAAVPSRHLDPALIGRERPDAVVLELAERALQAETPLGPPP
jgi:hypothetical protein